MFYVRCTHAFMRAFEMGGQTQLLTPTMLTYMKPQMESDVAKRDMLHSSLTNIIFYKIKQFTRYNILSWLLDRVVHFSYR